MLFSSFKKSVILIFVFFSIFIFSKDAVCRTPADLDRVIDEFEHTKNTQDQLKLAYLGLDLYAPIRQKSDVDPGDRITLSQMKRMVLTNAMDRAGKDILITAVGTTGYWVLERMDRIVNNYPAEDQDRIVQLKRKGCYMEGLSDLDFVIMGANAAVYRDNIYRIFAEGAGNVHLVPDEMEELEISFITDDQIKDLSPGPKGRKFWDQLMNLEESSPHPEKYITKGGKALYGMEHLYEEGAVALSNKSENPELFHEYADKAGHHMGPFTIVHLFGGSCDMDYFLSHALEKSNQESVKTILQVMKYLKRQEWMLRKTAKNINRLPSELPQKPDSVKSLENYASEITKFVDKAVEQKVWKSPQAAAQFGKEARSLSGIICSFAHEILLKTGDDLLTLRKNKQLTDETGALLTSIVFDLVTVDEERYPNGYPAWYSNPTFSAGTPHTLMPRDKTLEFLKRYNEGETGHVTEGPAITMPDVKKKKKMDTGPILPPPAAYIEIKKVEVSPEKPLAGAPVTFTVSGSVHGVSETLPDFTKNEYSDEEQIKMEKLGTWSLMATMYRMQIQYLMEQDLLSKQAESSSEMIYVSPYEIASIAEDYLSPAEDEIALLSRELNRSVSEDKSGKYAFRVRPVPSIQSIKEYVETLESTCSEAKDVLDKINFYVTYISASLEIALDENESETTIFVTDKNDSVTIWDGSLDSYVGNTMYESRQNINRESLSARLADFRDKTNRGISYINDAIEYAEEVKKRIDQMEGLLSKDPSTAAEIAGEIQKKLEVLSATTIVSITGAKNYRERLIEGITDAHYYVATLKDPAKEKMYRNKVSSMVDEWKEREKELSEKTLPALEKKEIWLRRGAWAAWGAKWAFEALASYRKYQEDKTALTSTDLNAGSEKAVLALEMTGEAIDKIVGLIPIPILESAIKNYTKILSDASTWASAMDSLQAMRYQDQGFDVRSAVLPAAYKSLLQHNPDLEEGLYYRTRMPLAEYNGLTILAYPMAEPTETGSKKRDRMWLIWDKHNPDGYLLLDKTTFEKMSLYAAWYRRVNGENISGEDLHALLTEGKITNGYIIKETITLETLRFKASTLLRIKALEAYFISLTGKENFKEEELFTYMGMLHHSAKLFAENGFLLTDPDVKEIMKAVFYEKPISGTWKTMFDIFGLGNADRVNESAALWDRLNGGEKDRLEIFLTQLIDKKVADRAREREKNWKESKVSENDDARIAAGLLYSETGLVFNHAFFSKSEEIYSDDFMDLRTENFTISWKTVMPDDTDIATATYLCVAEIAGYPGTRTQYALPMDTLENDILKQMLELAETAEEKGNTAWSTCQNAATGMFLFEERKDDFTTLLEKLEKINQDFNAIQLQAIEAPGVVTGNFTELKRLSDVILKDLSEIENIRQQICEFSGSTDPGEKGKQIRLLEKMKVLMEVIRGNFSKFKKLYEQSENALTAYNKFENMIKEYESLIGESGWAKGLSDGFASSLSDLSDAEKYKIELTELKKKADALLAEAQNVYSAPESESVLEEIKTAHSRVERPLNELKASLDMANSRKDRNLPLWERVNPEITKADITLKEALKKWEILGLKKEEMETLGNDISELWQTTRSQFLAGENAVTEAETCMGKIESDSETPVPDVSGMSMSAAGNRVKEAGFKPVFRGGNPAPSKDLAYTVASQSPEPGEMLSKGSSVNMILYGNFAGNIIPDVKGLSSKDAKTRLENAGFRISLSGGDPAPSENLKFKVQSQEPAAGEKAEHGSVVNIRIHGDIHYVSVPSLVSMTAGEAKAAVTSAGLIPSLFGGNSAPQKALSYRVHTQTPDPGDRVLYGSMVSIQIYGDFNEQAALENANCNNLAGSTLKWDYQKDCAICQCPSGMVINNDGNACIKDPSIEQNRERRNQFLASVINIAAPIIIDEITGGNSRGNRKQPGQNPSDNDTSDSGDTGSSTMSHEDCELKFCPECNKKDKGIDLLGVAVSPQCNECRERKKTEIEKCMRGEKTGQGTKYVKKEYQVYKTFWWNEEKEEYELQSYTCEKAGSMTGYYEPVGAADTWANCKAKAEALNYEIRKKWGF